MTSPHLVQFLANDHGAASGARSPRLLTGVNGIATQANYQFSPYVAEMANTLSNLVTVCFALYGALRARQNALPFQFVFQFLGLAAVGWGSFAFHATLLYGPQLADELPMILVASYSCFLLYDTQPEFSMRNKQSLRLLIGLIAFNVLFTWSFAIYRNPTYFQTVFAFLVLALSGRITYLIRRSSSQASKLPEETKTSILRVFWTGGGLFIFAFFIWNLDNLFCSRITVWKRAIGWPAAFLLESHAWWHVLTALGTYLMMVGVIYISVCVKDTHQGYTLAYTRFGLPHVARVSLSDSKSGDHVYAKAHDRWILGSTAAVVEHQ